MALKRGWYWPWLVTAALLFTVGVNVVMFVAAGGDPNGTVVEPDYYRKAVDWDHTMARRAASERLGWRSVATLTGAAGDSATLRVTVEDRAGVPVVGARFTAELIHNLAAAHPLRVTLAERAPGAYESRVPVAHAGVWEVRLEARRADDRFLATLHAELRPEPARRVSAR